MAFQNVIPISIEEFEPLLGKKFNVMNTDLPVELELVEVSDSTKGHPWPPNFPKPFSMIFSGPPERILAEGLRAISLPGGPAFQLHLIPILTQSPMTTGQQYQVVIN